ncbi:MAG: SDR family oxidoreductase [Nocardiaceae bacterium]|nr:SDR family oxidoreductase [Nocardiaceae bacterium]
MADTTSGRLGNVLITGGASGLGAATVTAVAEAGGTALVLDVTAPANAEFSALVDVADTESVQRAVDDVVARAGGTLDAVFTAAGIDAGGDLDTVDADKWEQVIKVNLLGTAATIRAALPYLIKSRGQVVTCASTLGLRAFPAETAYCASEFGIVGFTRALAAETAGRVRVTLLVPGGMDTSILTGQSAGVRALTDLASVKPAAVAQAVLFALQQPADCDVRELIVGPSADPR